MSYKDKLMNHIVQLLNNSQMEGYVTKENEDLEVSQWMGGISYEIAQYVEELLEPEQYIKVDGKFYRITDLEQLDAVVPLEVKSIIEKRLK